MTITTYYPEKQYPYLAVWVGIDASLTEDLILAIKKEDIVIISVVDNEGSDKIPYVQPLLGGKQGYKTKNENEYCALPKGYSVTICQ